MRKSREFKHQQIRYYQCGEYGETYHRPHYHACLFGVDFPDKEVWRVRDGVPLYTSDILDRLWSRGFSTIGEVNFETAAYCARYILKKVNGRNAEYINPETGLKHYERIHTHTGEIVEVIPEYTTMSRRPGIGRDWLDAYSSDVYPADALIINGHETRPPRYYDNIYEVDHPESMDEIKTRRTKKAHELRHNATPDRLAVREKVKKAQISILKRNEVK